jgi:transcription initiation factor TFIIIB Brf1 subunit/transcription initiation factor TFIIB
MEANSKTLNIPLSEARARYEAGQTQKEIAAIAGVSYQSIGRRLKAMGVTLRGRAMAKSTRRHLSTLKRLDIPENLLRELHSRRMSCREMAAVLGCHEETIRQRLIEMALPRLPGQARPDRNTFWNGGYTVDDNGYILQHSPDHPHATKGGYVRQHRLVMEKKLGRYLAPREVVDHRNGDTSDNSPENLRLFASNAEHLRATLTGRRVPAAEREHLKQEAVRRARARVQAILAESGNGAGQ